MCIIFHSQRSQLCLSRKNSHQILVHNGYAQMPWVLRLTIATICVIALLTIGMTTEAQAQTLTGSIGDNIWLDLDGDGIQGPNESGIPGVMVALTDSSGNVLTAITDSGSNGNYLFADLPYGIYTVSINPLSLPPGLGQTYDPDGLLDHKASVVIDANNVDDRAQDFGYEPQGSIGDTVWLDVNRDGIQNPGESGAAGVVLFLTDSSGNVSTTTANIVGNYLFDSLSYGLYIVNVDIGTLPPTALQSYDSDGTLDNTSAVLLDSNNPHNRVQDFGYEPRGFISDTVWMDLDGNGLQEPGEDGISDVGLMIVDSQGNTFTSTTDINGHYLFDDLTYENYTMEVDIGTLPLGLVQTYDSDGILDHRTSITVGIDSPDDAHNQGFGYRIAGSIGDRIWLDGDGDGVQDTGEVGIANITVMLTSSGGFTYTAMTKTVTDTVNDTVVSGHYIFEALPLDSYTVTVDLTTLPANLAQTFDEDDVLDHTSAVTLSIENLHDQAQDFGYQPLGSIGDVVWMDLDANGIQDLGEIGIPGVIVTLIGSRGDTMITVTDAENGGGHYRFDALPYDTYTIVVDPTTLPPFSDQTYDSDSNNNDDLDHKSTVTLDASLPHNLAQNFGYRSSIEPSIRVELLTRGAGQTPDDADNPPGPVIPVNRVVVWTYEVTNSGNVDLATIELSDDIEGPVTLLISGDDDSDNILDVGEIWLYTMTGVAGSDQYSNMATVVGQPVDANGDPLLGADGQPIGTISNTDNSHYFGAVPSINLEKAANNTDGDIAPGPVVPVGTTVSWTYEVTNSGNVALDDITVRDNQGSIITCPRTTLAIGENMTCTATGEATLGQYEGLGSVDGTPIDGNGESIGPPVRNQDPSHYYGSQSAIRLEKSINGADADTGVGPFINVGDNIIQLYEISNAGNSNLSDILITDDQDIAIFAQESSPGINIGDLNGNGLLDVSEVWFYEANSSAEAGQYESFSSVEGQPVNQAGEPLLGAAGAPVSDQDGSHYFGNVVDPELGGAIDIECAANNVDGDNAPGIHITPGEPIVWTYEVRNPGDLALANVSLSDEQRSVILAQENEPGLNVGDTNQDGLLDPDEVWLYRSLPDTALVGQHENIATAQAIPVNEEKVPLTGAPLQASDTSHYFGVESAIQLTALAGNAADGALYFTSAGDVGYTFIVENVGNISITDIEITDDNGTPNNISDDRLMTLIQCPRLAGPLAPQGDPVRCTFTKTVDQGETNIATATAMLSDSSGDPILSVPNPVDSDEAIVRITEPAIALEKSAYRGHDDGLGCSLGEGRDSIYTVVGEHLTYCFAVTNTGNTYLDRAQIIDDYLGVTLNISQTLAPGGSMILHANTIAQEDIVNIANVIGLPSDASGIPTGQPIVGADDRAEVEVDLVTIGNLVWFDNNGNGQQDAGELPVAGITVTLLDGLTGDVILDANGNPVTTVTDAGDDVGDLANGNYSFDNLPPDNYAIEFDLSTLPPGFYPTQPNQGNDGRDSDTEPENGRTTTTGILFGGDEYTGLDMGIVAPVTVGDRVWYDHNGDDVQDAPEDEPGVPDVSVTLLDGGTGQPIPDENGDLVTAVTDENGNYAFTDLQPGNYAVDFDLNTLPDGYGPTLVGQNDDTQNGRVTASIGFLSSGKQDMTLDLGIIAPVSLGNLVWLDNDRNGLQDTNEPGIVGVTVTLLDGYSGRPFIDESGAPITVVTDSEGNYIFDNLRPGNYAAQFDLKTLPVGCLPTLSNQGDDGRDSDGDRNMGKTLPTGFLHSGEHVENLDQGCILHP